MGFECKECGNKVTNSEALGLAVATVSKTVIENKIGASAFSKAEFSAGLLSGFKVPCPDCDKSNWKSN